MLALYTVFIKIKIENKQSFLKKGCATAQLFEISISIICYKTRRKINKDKQKKN